MPARLYHAPAASGKTTYAVNLARETAASLMAEVRVCVPTSLQAHAWRARLAEAEGAIGIHVLTFDELVAQILDHAGENYVQLSEPVQIRLLRAIIDRLHLVHFAPLRAKPGFIQLLQQLITELKFAQIFPDDFLKAAQSLGNEPRLVELGLIYSQYQEQLRRQRWADRVGLYWLAAESLEDTQTNTGRNWPLLIIDGFDDFTPIQLTLIEQLAGRVGNLVITLTQAEKINYTRYKNTRQEIEEKLGLVSNQLATLTANSHHPDLVYLAENLFSRQTEPLPPDQSAISLIEAADRTAEVRAALRWLRDRIILDGFNPGELALLANSTTPYQPYIDQIAAEFGLPVRLVEGRPLSQNPLIAALLNLLRLILPVGSNGEPELARRMVISTWRSPYFNLDFLDEGDPDSLDNLGRQQRVIRGLSQWQAAFETRLKAEIKPFPAAWESDEEEPSPRIPENLAVKNLYDKFNRFLSLIEPPSNAASMRDFVGWLEDLIGPDPEPDIRNFHPTEKSLQITAMARRADETAEADIAALKQLKDILRGFVWAEEALGVSRSVGYSYFFNELLGSINGTFFRLPEQGNPSEILVADAARARGLSFKTVVVMGLSEGEFPTVISEDPLLRDSDRKVMSETLNFSLESSTLSAEREFFYEAITRPSQKLLLTRPTLADNGAPWPPSPFWDAVHTLIGSPALSESVSAESLIPLESVASWPEFWQSLTQAYFSTGHLLDPIAWHKIEQSARIMAIRGQVVQSEFEGDLPQLTSQLQVIFGPDHTWSASRLETYQKCPYFFYVQNVLRLEPRLDPVEGLDVTQLGTVYHKMFEAAYNAGLPDPLNESSVRELVRAAATPILEEAPKQLGFRETPWWSQTREEMIENVAVSILVLEDGEYEFFRSEAAFGINELDKLIIETAVGTLQLRGFIDRIDRSPDGKLRIIDYKLGGPYQFNKRAFQEGKKLQLPLYALAAQETLGLGQVAEGFYWHFRQSEKSGFTLSTADGGVHGAFETAVSYAAQAVDKIRAGEFKPSPPTGGCPSYCPAAAFCWQYSPANW